MTEKVYTSKFSGQEVDQKLEKIMGPILQVPNKNNLVFSGQFGGTEDLELGNYKPGYYCFRATDSADQDEVQYADIYFEIVSDKPTQSYYTPAFWTSAYETIWFQFSYFNTSSLFITLWSDSGVVAANTIHVELYKVG